MQEVFFVRIENFFIQEIKIMLKSGMHIGCHGYNHYWWNKLSLSDLEQEIDLSLHFLKNLGLDPDEIRLKMDQIMEWNEPNTNNK